MKLIILGSGTGIPLADRASPSIVLKKKDAAALFDMGPGALRQLAKAGISHENIERIFITHFHPDHTADLIHLLFATRIPSVLQRRKPFTITAPKGFIDFLEKLQSVYSPWLELPSEILKVEELDIKNPVNNSYNSFEIISQHVDHTPHSLAYRINIKQGKSIVYSGDTGFCEEIIELAMDADILILECAFPDGEEQEGHLTPSQAGHIAALSKTKKLVLTHFYPEVLETDIKADCRKTYEGELILAKDLMMFDV